jgi:flagellar biosynthesis/type III secretory pathway M-ring protein FliF/YscJ
MSSFGIILLASAAGSQPPHVSTNQVLYHFFPFALVGFIFLVYFSLSFCLVRLVA